MDTTQGAFSTSPPGADMAFGMPAAPASQEPVAPLPAPAPAPTHAQAPRWLTDNPRQASQDLAWPFALDGVVYRTIILRRLTAGEVAAFTARLRALPEGTEWPRVPMYFLPGAAGDPEVAIPDAAWDAMDDDDRLALSEAARAFLPARFRA